MSQTIDLTLDGLSCGQVDSLLPLLPSVFIMISP